MQSFDDALLKTLGRIHSAEQAKHAIEIAQQRFDNISIDLMCGLPGQTLTQFQNDLEPAGTLGVTHISVYPLMVEEGTPFASMVDAGTLVVDEDAGAEGMELAT